MDDRCSNCGGVCANSEKDDAMNILKKWLTVPVSNDTTQVDVVETWSVRWTSRDGEFSSNTRPEMEVFTSETDAENFATSLRNAFALLRHRGVGTQVTVRRGH
jgi:hypothetical protein